MTLLQEAYTLMQEQPEKNIQLIVELLQTMSPRGSVVAGNHSKTFKRTGLARGLMSLPSDFDETFDALDKDIEEMFYGGDL